MKVLMISSDQKILDERSEVRARMAGYGKLFEELHIVIPTVGRGPSTVKIAGNVVVHPTNSLFKFMALLDASGLAEGLIEAGGRWVITAQDPFEHGWIAYWLSRQLECPLQLQVHTDLMSPFFAKESLKNRIRVMIAKRILPKANGVRVVSDRIRRSLEGIVDPRRITVLPIFTDLSGAKPGAPIDLGKKYPGKDFFILMASRLTREKNIPLALEAMAEVVRAHPRAALVIVGDGPEGGSLKLKIKNLKLENHVFLESYTSDLDHYYRGADVLLLTSNYEGYGRVPVEAASAGLPVVMTDVGVAIGKVVPVGDRQAVVAALRELIEHREKGEALVAAQKQFLATLPASPAEYEKRYAATLELLPPRRLLFITQKIDKDDGVLGVYHHWVEELAKTTAHISVICLYQGRTELPENVTVYSLGKEHGQSRLKYIFNFYKYLWRLRGAYDRVLVHMNPEYMLLAGWWWKMSGREPLLWYNHPMGDWKARIAIALASKVLHTSPFAFSARYKKAVAMPVGIDTDAFRPMPSLRAAANQNSILYLGRLSPIKYIEVLIDALLQLDAKGIDFTLTIAGEPSKESEVAYAERLKRQAESLVKKGKVVFRKGVPNTQAVELYNSHALSVNLTPTGSFDKTIIEAMACETPVIASNKALETMLAAEFLFKERSADDLAEKIGAFLKMPETTRREIGSRLRAAVLEKHSLARLSERLHALLEA